MLLSSIFVCAQNHIEDESYVSNAYIPKNFDLPIVRKVYGGTKIKVEYEGDWTNEMKGAVEYACKIWEETMPTTLPLKFRFVLDNIVKSKSLSKYSINVCEARNPYGYEYPYTDVSTWTQMKCVKYMVDMGKWAATQYDDSLYNEAFFTEPDVKIVYYNYGDKIKNECSFDISEEYYNDKYDFVSLVLRDIAKSFGLVWNYRNTRNNQFHLPASLDKVLPYEKQILKALGYDGSNSKEVYLNALKDSIKIEEKGYSCWLYAPRTWDMERSLNYFMPEKDNKLTQLLSYDFGKGSHVRDITGYKTHAMFEHLLKWGGDIATGSSGFGEVSGSTDKFISMDGKIELGQLNKGGRALQNSEISFSDQVESNSVDRIDKEGWYVYLLLKDGTWDNVYSFPFLGFDLEISLSNFKFNHNIEEYDRSCDGFLRCRIIKSQHSFHNSFIRTAYYYLIDYLPQQVKVAKSKIMPCEDEDEYDREVVIGIKDLEGIEKVTVEQLDEYNDVPYYYEVNDFRKGTFIATVDREFSSTFTVHGYNKNGTSKSLPYTLLPITPPEELKYSYEIKNDRIRVTVNSRRYDANSLVSSYEISSADGNRTRSMNNVYKRGYNFDNIDISDLNNGIYVLTVYDKYGKTHGVTFIKK